MKRPASEQVLSTNAVAQLLGVHPKHVFRLLKRGLPGHRLGGEWRFDKDEVLAWVRTGSPDARAQPPPLVAANGDVCVELLLALLAGTSAVPVGLVQADRTSGRAYLEQARVLAAGVHGDGIDEPRSASLVSLHLTRRSIGLAYVKGKRVRSLRQLPGLRLASRSVSAGVRVHLDRALAAEGLDSSEVHARAELCTSHRDVALSVLAGRADAGIMTVAWANRAGLGCLAFTDEDYALALRADSLALEPGRGLVRALQSAELKRALSRVGGYDPSAAGSLV